jgi:hypothetical protein
VPRVVGISGIEQGSVVAERYRVVERLSRFALADRSLTGVEYEYWLAFDQTRSVEVWLQIGDLGEVTASGAQFAGAVAALRRLNHPAFPAILDFGEIEVAGAGGDGEEDTVVDVGYAVLEPVEGESLAAVLMRGALTEVEVFATLAELADALKLLHEMELVHGHLSAYSVLLTERGVLLIDIVASLALETAAGSVLTPAADVYALAWLACVALAGVEAVEAEFGVGFDAGSSPEDEHAPGFLTAELVERRCVWAQRNLAEVFGVEAGLAALLVAGLGESAVRPEAATLAGALRARGVIGVAEEEVEAVGVEEAEEAGVAGAVGFGAAVGVGVAAAVGVETAEVASGAAYGGMESSGAAAAVGGAGGGGVAVATMTVGAQKHPETVPPSRPTQHRRPKSALYVAVGIVVLIVIAIVWGLSARKSPTAGASNSAGPTSAVVAPSVSAGGSSASAGAASPSASAGVGQSPSVGASSGAGAGSPSASVGAGASSSPGSGVMATAPSSPSQALQQIQQAIGQAQAAGGVPSQAQGSLNQAVGTLQQEISSGGSVSPGISQLRQALTTPGLSQTLVSQVNSLIQYLSPSSGS